MLKRTATSSSGRQANWPVITDWDLAENRGIRDILAEGAQIGGWTVERAHANLNFGWRNVRMNECARNSETTPKRMRAKVDAQPGLLLQQKQTDEACGLANEILDADDAKIEAIYDRLFPNGSVDTNGDILHGAEATTKQDG